jgi:hypothetical protein
MAQPNVTPRARVADPVKLYRRALKKRRGVVPGTLTEADYAELRAALEAPPLIKRGRPRSTAAGVAEARVTRPVRTCERCGEVVGPRRRYCDAHASASDREKRRVWQQRWREAHPEANKAAQRSYREKKRAERQRRQPQKATLSKGVSLATSAAPIFTRAQRTTNQQAAA